MRSVPYWTGSAGFVSGGKGGLAGEQLKDPSTMTISKMITDVIPVRFFIYIAFGPETRMSI